MLIVPHKVSLTSCQYGNWHVVFRPCMCWHIMPLDFGKALHLVV